MTRWNKLADHLNDTRHVTPAHLRTLGIPQSTFSEHARRFAWAKPDRGLWVPPGVDLTYRERLHVLSDALGKVMVVTGATALHLDKIIDEEPRDIHVLLPLHRVLAAREGVCFHHTADYDNIRYHRSDNLRIARTPRALADDACHEPWRVIAERMAKAARLRRTTLHEVKKELDRRKRFPGRRSFRTAFEGLTGELTHSGAERMARRLLREAGENPFPRPLTVTVDGAPRAEIDIPFVELLYGVEVDGPHHLLANIASADRARDRALAKIGWAIDRFWWHEVEERSAWFVQAVTNRLAELRSSRR
jgi:hypothetical protein